MICTTRIRLLAVCGFEIFALREEDSNLPWTDSESVILPLYDPGSSSPPRIRTLNFGTKIRGLAIRRTGRGIGGICTLVHAFAEHCLATRPRHHASGRRGSNPQNLLDGSQVLYQLSYVRMHYIV